MNERIRQFAQQVGFKVDWQHADVQAIKMERFEKFAELIVKECIDIAQDRANFPGYPPNDVNDIIDEIREHFGVEE
jgi:uncharacterized protein YutE (UPF0331/DUF86 family)